MEQTMELKLRMDNADICGRCKGWKNHGCVGECSRASYLLVTKPSDVCRLRN